MKDEALQRKRDIFEARKGTTHWPVCIIRFLSFMSLLTSSRRQNMNIVPADSVRPTRPDDSTDVADRNRPFHEPLVTPAVLKLVGAAA